MFYNSKRTNLLPKKIDNRTRFPSFTKPWVVGAFSVDGNRLYSHSRKNCKYVYKQVYSERRTYDLNTGIDNVVRKVESCKEEKLSHLLQFILDNLSQIRQPTGLIDRNKVLMADFVCFRGLLRQIMCTPYEYREPWIILAIKFKDTIYLCAEETQKQAQDRVNQTDTLKKILSYGFKFEQFILTGLTFHSISIYFFIPSDYFNSTDDPCVEPMTDIPVNENEEFCCMFSATLNGNKLLYGAEMDGIEEYAPIDIKSVDFNRCNFVELKVKLLEQNERQRQNYFRFKLRNWWCQTFLANIQKIIVGTRNDDGIVDGVSVLHVRDIPKQNKVLYI